MSNITVDEVKQYILLDKKINDRAYKIAQEFNLYGGEFDSVYLDYSYLNDLNSIIVIEMGKLVHGEYVPATHYLTPEEFCLPNGRELFEARIKKEYEEFKNKEKENKRKVYKVDFGDKNDISY